MSETKNETTYQPMTFDAIKIGLASPETGNVIVVNIKRSDIRALSATVVV